MYRELSIDASQITLGDPINLTLEVGTENNDKTLTEVLKQYQGLKLVFRNLSESGSEPESYFWKFSLRKDALAPPKPADNADQGQLPFREISYPTDEISLLDKASVQFSWQISTWDELGTFTVEGYFTDSRLDSDDQLAPLTDFGPVKLRVIDPVDERPAKVTLQAAGREVTPDQALWTLIRHRTINFARYRSFVDRVMCADLNEAGPVRQQLRTQYSPFSRVASWGLLKNATEFYLMQEAGLALDHDLDYDALNGVEDIGGNRNRSPRLEQLRRRAADSNRLGGANIGALRNAYLDELSNQEGKVLPYFGLIRDKLADLPLKKDHELGIGCYGILKSRLQSPPLMELIWSYWHEEGGLVQTMNMLSLRFQNVRRGGPGQDPLANINIDPLRPLGNLLWGYIEDERNRLTLNRRNLEYRYEYGYSLIGKAVQDIPVAEHRTNFQHGFHSLLRAAVEFYQQANFTTVIPDGFPMLNNLREVHLLLAEGAHNQYGDLPWTARAEMLSQQWLLARPEVREFLGGRVMVPYSEPWMDRVDNMKQLQGWNPTNISHFRDLGAFGEQLLLSIRYGSWNDPTIGASNAANWAHYWREEIQRYIHAYKAVTGVDIASDIVDARVVLPASEDRYQQPGALIERQAALQAASQQRNRQLSSGAPIGPPRPVAVPGLRRVSS
ncbi:hypothetical protein [Hymenobacter rubripertinctus]|uniref:8-amino-7-oxononanoate synthase n=1 Tax=Hymenobacter rubripertinctus TaxID=2029981 RepID=A0A418R0T6_9BACT|nr:hypothetical protein [Hymenobacter rubripertinctus]RIY11011.1 hypothetical protein D0T11_08350 [Hymenobacter rubripertinctus]